MELFLVFTSFVLFGLVLIFFALYCIQLYTNKYISYSDINNENLKSLGSKLYVTSICTIFSFLLFSLYESSLNDLIILMVFSLMIISLITHILFNKKIFSNILCGIALFIIATTNFYFVYDEVYPFESAFPKSESTKSKDNGYGDFINFNSIFTQYEGSNVRGSTVNIMLQEIVSNNSSQNDDSRKVEVEFRNFDENELKDSSNNPVSKLSKYDTQPIKVKTGATYSVECLIGNDKENKGLVYCVVVTKNTNKPITENQ